MNREELEQYIRDHFDIEPDYPWISWPENAVFRHRNNKKWFALIMNVERVKLGLSGSGQLSIVNLKCDPLTVGSLRSEPGFFPAYHMNKEKWITASLDGTAPADRIIALLEMSYDATGL